MGRIGFESCLYTGFRSLVGRWGAQCDFAPHLNRAFAPLVEAKQRKIQERIEKIRFQRERAAALKVWKGGGGKSPAVVLHVATPNFKFGPEIFPRISQLRKFLAGTDMIWTCVDNQVASKFCNIFLSDFG